MKFYLIGNSTCANRGDAAILRGLINFISKRYAKSEMKVVSRFPKAAEFVLGQPIGPDVPYELSKSGGSILNKVKQRLFQQIRYEHLYLMIRFSFYRRLFRIPKRYQAFLDDIEDYDAILQVGGSFFIDLYGLIQFEALMIMILAEKPVYLMGHSLGPFQKKRVNRFASAILPQVKQIYIRESETLNYLSELSRSLDNVQLGADTAWLLPDLLESRVADAELPDSDKPLVALTFRNLKPFDKRLGVTQDEYEDKLVNLIDGLIDSGYGILGLSMCTGLNSYGIDDRMVALRIKRKLRNPDMMKVMMHEYTELELGYLLSKCELLIGTRLHSVIIALRYNTPALAIYYEHKSLGILKKLGLGGYSMTIDQIDSSEIFNKIQAILNNSETVRDEIATSVRDEIKNAENMVSVLDKYVS